MGAMREGVRNRREHDGDLRKNNVMVAYTVALQFEEGRKAALVHQIEELG